MNLNKIFKMFSNKGINEVQLSYSSTSSFNMKTFHGEIENFTSSINDILFIEAKINNKIICVSTQDLTKNGLNNLIDNLIKNSVFIHDENDLINNTKSKYKKCKLVFNKELETISNERKKEILIQLENKVRSFDNRFIEVETYYFEESNKKEIKNTFGINAKEKSNIYTIYIEGSLKVDEQIISEVISFSSNDFAKFNLEEFAYEYYKKISSKINPIEIKSNKYNVVFDPDVVDTFVSYYTSQLNADLIIKNVSFFKDKLNIPVANKKVTILETPLKKDLNFEAFDFEGTPTQNICLIKKGVLQTYLYNLRTAKIFNTVSNGHAMPGSKISASTHQSLYLKPGKLSREDIFMKIKDGIYINSLEGLHAGLNAQSGNFSLKAEGFEIKNGVIGKPIKMMTVNGNLFDIFKRVKLISKNYEYEKTDCFAPYIFVNKIAISN